MPIIKSAVKRMKQTVRRNERNVGLKRDIKEATKTFLAKPTSEGLSKVHSTLDTAAKKNLLKKNTVARRKAQFAKIAKNAGVKIAPAKKAATTKPAATKKAATTTKPATKKTTATAAKKPAAKKATTKAADKK